MDIQRIDKYTIEIGSLKVRCDADTEARLRAMNEENQQRFVKILGGHVA